MQADLEGGIQRTHANKFKFFGTIKRPSYWRFCELKHTVTVWKTFGWDSILRVPILQGIAAVNCPRAVSYSSPNRRKWRQQQEFSQWSDQECSMLAISQRWWSWMVYVPWRSGKQESTKYVTPLTSLIQDWNLGDKWEEKKGLCPQGLPPFTKYVFNAVS